MASSPHLSAAPSGEYGQESILPARSLPYVSSDAATSVESAPYYASHNRDHASSSGRRYTFDSDSDCDFEMAEVGDEELRDIPELPHSVAESPLFTLPREIRDRIYTFCLTSQNGRQVEWPTQWKSYTLQPQLLRTCKIVYNEAAPLLYTLNTMTFHHPSDANMFVRAVSAPILSRHIANLNLHIKAQDTRLWMPYLTSKDHSRSLKADFPNLRELSIRFRSNKWQHQLPPESNMKIWSEDSRLDEVVDGLRHVFLPDLPHAPKNEGEFETWLSNHSSSFPLNPGEPFYKKQWLDIRRARATFSAKKESTPTIRVVCACRVHERHYNALTTVVHTPVPDLAHAGNGTGVIQQQSDDVFAPPLPVQEGERFRGFTAIDLQSGMKRLHDPDLGSANVARTPFAEKNGILLSLEIHCLDPRRDNTTAQGGL